MPRKAALVALLVSAACLIGCSNDGLRGPVFGAVFGLTGAEVTPHTLGKVPEPVAHAGDRLIGKAANNPGLCIWENHAGRRFRAGCAEA